MIDKNQVKIVVVDDERAFQETLERYLKRIGFEKIIFADSFDKGKLLIDAIIPDIVLLDVDLRETKTGIDLGVHIRLKNPNMPIVFFSNNFNENTYAAAKQVKPSAFLDKEVTSLKVQQAIELALNNDNDTLINKGKFTTHDFVFVKVGQTFKKISLSEVNYVFYADRYANLMIDEKTYPLSKTMKDLSKILSSDLFIQIHQSYIVNISCITQVSLAHGEMVVAGKTLPIGVSYKKTVEENLPFLF
jgi:two-component system, LytTR family, response regulator LytT